MSLLKKLALSGLITLSVFSNNLEASLSSNKPKFQTIHQKKEIADLENPYVKSFRKNQNNYLEYGARKNIKASITLGYEEWKKAIENPESREAYNVALKSRIISLIGAQLVDDLSDKEKEEYKIFWDSFRIHTEGIIPKDCDDKTTELIFNYSVPAILDTQLDVVRTYKSLFNFNNLSEGEKFLVYTHIKHDLKYQADGNKRKTPIEKILEEKSK